MHMPTGWCGKGTNRCTWKGWHTTRRCKHFPASPFDREPRRERPQGLNLRACCLKLGIARRDVGHLVESGTKEWRVAYRKSCGASLILPTKRFASHWPPEHITPLSRN